MSEILEFLFAPYAEYSQLDIWLEIIGVIFGLLSVYFATRENILVYPTGLISTAIYVYVCYTAGLFGDMGINAYYFAMSIYGWYMWTRPAAEKAVLPISIHNQRERILSISLFVLFYLALAFVLVNFTPSTVPYIDAFTTSIFFVGMWEMARKKVENWVYWIIGDLVSVPLYIYKGLTLTGIQFLVFTALAIRGYLEWRKKYKKENKLKVVAT
ncbi:MAG: nicotinamide riboside transporter PnuC [Bacteroidota bacterium]